MALCEGADIYLVDPQYWKDNKVHSVPPSERHTHPNVCFPGMNRSTIPDLYSSAGTLLSNTDYTNNVAASLANLGPSQGFDFAALERLMQYASSHIIPMKEETQYVVLLSPVQASQLRRDPDFLATNMHADKRGSENRALSGVIGNWQGFKFIEDKRSPIFHLDSSKRGFEYVTYETGTKIDRYDGIASIGRKGKAAQGTATGSCEVARVVGAGAIGVPLVDGSNLTFKEEPSDFGDFGEICGRKNTGHCRLDFKNEDESTLENTSSALFFTATPASFTAA
jgi:hypothetical protein